MRHCQGVAAWSIRRRIGGRLGGGADVIFVHIEGVTIPE